MLDVDGTLVPYDYEALPSEAVVDAVEKAKDHVTVCIVTGRSYGFTKPVLDKLGLHTGFGVFNNGGQVMDLATRELIYNKHIDVSDAREIVDILHNARIPFFLKQEVTTLGYKRGHFSKKDKITTPYMFFTEETEDEENIERVLRQLSHLSNIVVHKASHKAPGKFGINIVHAEATKLHGVHEVIKKLEIEPEHVIGVGDGYNDFPLLMASGLKVAMGNAVEDLKEIADFVAPTVHDDGVAKVIDKYILQSA